jgi:PAS domain S-box-containing protein
LWQFLNDLLAPSELTPHGFCLLWEPGLIWLHAVSDSLIALAYFSIPLVLLAFIRRRPDVAHGWVALLFAAFILACGTLHVMDVVTLWRPYYMMEGVIKLITAALSIATAAVLWPLLPKALALPSQSMLLRANEALADRVAELDRVARQLRESEKRARVFINTPAKLFTLDLAAEITGVSDRWLELLGTSRANAIGRDVRHFLHPDCATAFDEAWYLVLQGQEIRDLELQVTASSLRTLDILLSLKQDDPEAGEAARILGALTDITERRRAEQDLQRTQARLHRAERMEAIGQLTGGIAHDFNNLLAVVVTNLDMLDEALENPSPTAQGRKDSHTLVTEATAAALNGAALTRQLLAFASRLPLEPQTIDLNTLSATMAALLSRTLGEQIKVTLASEPDLWPIAVDPSQLDNAVLNLALNARDAMPQGGTLRIETSNVSLTAKDVADLPEVSPGDFVLLEMTDTGVGMSPEVLRRAFEPFFTTKPESHGTGLGLSMVYGFTRQSGGHVRILSAPGEGTTVRLFLPRGWQPADRTQDAAGPAAMPRGTETILVVDDNDAVRIAAARILTSLGYAVLEADSGVAALGVIEQATKVDLLFSDVVMPGDINGVALAERVLTLWPAIAVLLTSGYANTDATATVPAQIGPILAKPYRRPDLASRVRAALDGWHRPGGTPDSPTDGPADGGA